MSKQPIKFSEYPLVVPNAKRMSKKLDKLVSDLKACQNANEAFKVINRINAFFEELETESSVIYVLYTCNTTNEEYKKIVLLPLLVLMKTKMIFQTLIP